MDPFLGVYMGTVSMTNGSRRIPKREKEMGTIISGTCYSTQDCGRSVTVTQFIVESRQCSYKE